MANNKAGNNNKKILCKSNNILPVGILLFLIGISISGYYFIVSPLLKDINPTIKKVKNINIEELKSELLDKIGIKEFKVEVLKGIQGINSTISTKMTELGSAINANIDEEAQTTRSQIATNIPSEPITN